MKHESRDANPAENQPYILYQATECSVLRLFRHFRRKCRVNVGVITPFARFPGLELGKILAFQYFQLHRDANSHF